MLGQDTVKASSLFFNSGEQSNSDLKLLQAQKEADAPAPMKKFEKSEKRVSIVVASRSKQAMGSPASSNGSLSSLNSKKSYVEAVDAHSGCFVVRNACTRAQRLLLFDSFVRDEEAARGVCGGLMKGKAKKI